MLCPRHFFSLLVPIVALILPYGEFLGQVETKQVETKQVETKQVETKQVETKRSLVCLLVRLWTMDEYGAGAIETIYFWIRI
jgi:predicted phage tail protein